MLNTGIEIYCVRVSKNRSISVYILCKNSRKIFFIISAFTQCFQFWYWMSGSNVGTLNVYFTEAGNRYVLWTESGSQSNEWHVVQVRLSIMQMSYMIVEDILVNVCMCVKNNMLTQLIQIIALHLCTSLLTFIQLCFAGLFHGGKQLLLDRRGYHGQWYIR